jgi:hypothetical protein
VTTDRSSFLPERHVTLTDDSFLPDSLGQFLSLFFLARKGFLGLSLNEPEALTQTF